MHPKMEQLLDKAAEQMKGFRGDVYVSLAGKILGTSTHAFWLISGFYSRTSKVHCVHVAEKLYGRGESYLNIKMVRPIKNLEDYHCRSKVQAEIMGEAYFKKYHRLK